MEMELTFTRDQKIKCFVSRLRIADADIQRLVEYLDAHDGHWDKDLDYDYANSFHKQVRALIVRLLGRDYIEPSYPDYTEDTEWDFLKDEIYERILYRIHKCMDQVRKTMAAKNVVAISSTAA